VSFLKNLKIFFPFFHDHLFKYIHNFFLIIDEFAYLIADFGFYRIVMHTFLTYSEMVIFKILYLSKFSIIAAIDEYFLTNFITLFNFMINLGFATVRVSLGEHKRTKIYFNHFAKSTDVYKKVPWP
jgi:hypothetical protein